MAKREDDDISFEERREYLRATKGCLEPQIADLEPRIAVEEETQRGPANALDTAADRRKHLRLTVTIPVRLESAAGGASIAVENCDISWGGLRMIVPKSALLDAEVVTIRLPWTKTEQIAAKVKVLRRESLNDERCLLAGRFAELSTSAHHRLEKLLQLLRRADRAAPDQEVPLVPILEFLSDDVEEIREKLAGIGRGRLSVATLTSYTTGESIRLVLGGIADAPALRLRARVEKAQALNFELGPGCTLYDLDLRFEHPLDELKTAAAALERYLPSQETEQVPDYDSYILRDPLDPDPQTQPRGSLV